MCACSGHSPCSGIDDPNGLWVRAAQVRVDVYSAAATCNHNLLGIGSASLVSSRVFDPHRVIQLDVPSGTHTIALTLFADAQATMVLATACQKDNYRSDSCLRFSLRPRAAGECQSDADCSTDGGATICCAHACIDPSSDPQNCGGCGSACGALNTVAACNGGRCATDCLAGWAHCSGETPGCETNLAQARLKLCNGACIAADSCCSAADCAFPPGPAECYAPACPGAGSACIYPVATGAAVCGSTCCVPENALCGADCSLHCATGFSDCDGASANGCECAGSSCCAGGTCQVKHDNGVGQSFLDCSALKTYDENQAMEACTAFTGDASQCHAISCGGSTAVCSDGSTVACDCWMYSDNKGKVKRNAAGSCSCTGNSNTATWT
jgi:hypothetical protein